MEGINTPALEPIRGKFKRRSVLAHYHSNNAELTSSCEEDSVYHNNIIRIKSRRRDKTGTKIRWRQQASEY